jgi:hypothetical protein
MNKLIQILATTVIVTATAALVSAFTMALVVG